MKSERILKFILFFSIVTSAVAVLILALYLDIHPDEAYYFSWSEFLRAGYVDHPPVIAYTVWLSRMLFDENLSIRGINIIIAFISLLFLYGSIRRVSNNRASGPAVIIIALFSPLFITGAVITTPDTPLILFVSAYLYFSLRSFEESSGYMISILSGISLGLAMLSKYTAFFIPLSLLILSFRLKRGNKIRVKLIFIPLIISILIYLPNLLYNINNNFKSYLFQLSHATSNPTFEPLKTFFPFVISQIFIFSPFLFIFFIKNIKHLIAGEDFKKTFLLYISGTTFTILTLLSIFKHVEANWGAFAFLPMLILTADEFIYKKINLISSIIYQTIIFIIILSHALFSILPLKPDLDPLTQVRFWRNTAELIQQSLPPDRTVVTFRYQISSELYYYSRRKITSLCLDRRFINAEIGLSEAKNWVMVDFFPAKTANDITLNICPDSTIRIPLVISKNLNIIRRIDVIYCK
ncbi:MAG: ArnT family glycosyltransferase [Myxococcota bacterium]